LARLQLLVQPLSGGLGATPYRRGRYADPRQATQHVLRGVFEGCQRPRQAHQRPCSRANAIAQPERLIIRAIAHVAAQAVVVSALHLHFAVHRQHTPLLPRVKLGYVGALLAYHTTADVPLFFRLARLACRTSLANCNPASRNSYSMAPNSSCSG